MINKSQVEIVARELAQISCVFMAFAERWDFYSDEEKLDIYKLYRRAERLIVDTVYTEEDHDVPILLPMRADRD